MALLAGKMVWILLIFGMMLFWAELAEGQGLNLDQEQLGAGEAATTKQFDVFEELLDLASQSTGGRGGKSRSSSSSMKTGAGFKSVKTLEQLQTSMFYIAGSPTVYNSYNTTQNPGGISLLPAVRDQGDCDTCVAHAIAAAIEAATAAAWRKNANESRFEVNAQSLYYCSEGGRSCKTGWDLQDALQALMDKGQHLIRPTVCAASTRDNILNNSAKEPDVFDWKPTCREAEQACAAVSSISQPWLQCTYKALSSFVEIQRHIRQHGAVLTRITIYDNFEKHFNVTRDGSGEQQATVYGATYKAYNRTRGSPTSRVLFAHAALIIGYDNNAFTWTVLNSWGQRTTKDGMFRIAMGVAGVAAPEQTYGIECKPAPGGPDDLHHTDWLTPWINNTKLKPRMPVEYLNADDWSNLNVSCYKYTVAKGDSVSSIADAFNIQIMPFVLDNQRLFPLQTVNYTLSTGTQQADLQRVVNLSNRVRPEGGREPYLVCKIYTGKTWFSSRICQQSNLQPCYGAWGCKVVFSVSDVSKGFNLGAAVRVCNISKVDKPGAFDQVAYFKDPWDSQPRVLVALLQMWAVTQKDHQMLAKQEIERLIPINPSSDQPAKWCSNSFTYYPVDLSDLILYVVYNYASCEITELIIYPVDNPALDWSTSTTLDRPGMVHALMNLNDTLRALTVWVGKGPLPPQLGALSQLQRLAIYHLCAYDNVPRDLGSLPDNWLRGSWRNTLQEMHVGADRMIGSSTPLPAQGLCGISGTIPQHWFDPPAVNLQRLELPYNKLTGTLPEHLSNSSKLQWLNVSLNSLSGTIPSSYISLRSLIEIDLESNKLSGTVPLGALYAAKGLRTLRLADNPDLKGCLPVPNPNMSVSYSNTKAQLCAAGAMEAWDMQDQFVQLDLNRLLGPNDGSIWHDWVGTIRQWVPHHIEDLFDQFGKGYPYLILCVLEPPLENDAIEIVSATEGVAFTYSPLCVKLHVITLDGAPHIEAISVHPRYSFSDKKGEHEFQRPNVQVDMLPAMLHMLPQLRSFVVADSNCTRKSADEVETRQWCLTNSVGDSHTMLPDDLPAAAPASLTEVALQYCGVGGTLPASWGKWTTLQSLDLSNNLIRGSLPASWANMSSLQFLDLTNNQEIIGAIPESWLQHFSAVEVRLQHTSLQPPSCLPYGWQTATRQWWLPHWNLSQVPVCGHEELRSLRQLKRVLQQAGYVPSTSPLSKWDQQTAADFAGSQPAYCRTWPGVTCDNVNNKVTALDLTSLGLQVKRPISLAAVLQPLRSLTHLQSLHLGGNPALFRGASIPSNISDWPEHWTTSLASLDISDCGLSGTIPDCLGALRHLKHFNISNNLGISGVLPELLAATSLEVLDVVDCGLSGPLPAVYAALPLRVLRVGSVLKQPALAAGDPATPGSQGISGMLPTDYGLLQSLQELFIANTAVSGSIPSAWFNPSMDAAQAAISTTMAAATTALEAARSSNAAAATAATDASSEAAVQSATSEARTIAPGPDQDSMHAQAVPVQDVVGAAWQLIVDRLRSLKGASLDAHSAAVAPAGEGLSMQQLQVLVLSGSKGLSGPLPLTLAALKQLQVLDLSGNALTGTLPKSWGQLSQLQQMDLSGNQLSGMIPATWIGLRSLTTMDISSNPAVGGALSPLLYSWAGQGSSLRCLKLYNTGITAQHEWFPDDLQTIKQKLESLAGSQQLLKVVITANDSTYC